MGVKKNMKKVEKNSKKKVGVKKWSKKKKLEKKWV